MEELIQQLKEKANLTDEQSVKAIQIMKDYIYCKVPPMFTGFVDNFFSEKSPSADTESFLP